MSNCRWELSGDLVGVGCTTSRSEASRDQLNEGSQKAHSIHESVTNNRSSRANRTIFDTENVIREMSERYLRYYAPTYGQDRHEKWIQLLNKIQTKHNIQWEEVPTATSTGLNEDWYEREAETTEEEIWEDELSHNRAIKKNDRDDRTPASKFKNQRNYHIQGIIAVIDPSNGIIHGDLYDTGTEFLEGVLNHGPSYLKKLDSPGGPSKHKQLVTEYQHTIEYPSISEYSVGESLIEEGQYRSNQKSGAKNMVSKSVDLKVEAEDHIELIEFKSSFESDAVEKALGQLLIYEHLYELDHPEDDIQLKAVFPEPSYGMFGNIELVGAREAVTSLLTILTEHGITVEFETGDGKFEPAIES